MSERLRAWLVAYLGRFARVTGKVEGLGVWEGAGSAVSLFLRRQLSQARVGQQDTGLAFAKEATRRVFNCEGSRRQTRHACTAPHGPFCMKTHCSEQRAADDSCSESEESTNAAARSTSQASSSDSGG